MSNEIDNGQDVGATPADANLDSGPMRVLRKKLKELEKEMKAQPSREQIEAEVREQFAREQSLEDYLVGLGHPRGAKEWILPKLEGQEVTFDAVQAVLADAGYDEGNAPRQAQAAATPTPATPAQANPDLAAITSLSAQVQAAATGSGAAPLSRRIAEASSQEELNAIMAEAGLARSHNP